jgi:hypothetical protein
MDTGASGVTCLAAPKVAAEERRTGSGSATVRRSPETEVTAPSTEACRPIPSPVTSNLAQVLIKIYLYQLTLPKVNFV